jgi:DnaJ like chaperone protein
MSYSYTLWFAFFGLLIGHAPGAITGAIIGFALRQPAPHPAQERHAGSGRFYRAAVHAAGRGGEIRWPRVGSGNRDCRTDDVADESRRRPAQAGGRQRFNAGKQPEFDVTGTINELRGWVGMRRDHAFPVLDVVIDTVLAEGNPAPEKMAILRQLAFALRVSEMELMALMAMKGYAWNGGGQRGYSRGTGYGSSGGYVPPQRSPQGPDPYAVLGIDRTADERAVKRAYRKLISEHHPDRLGDLPEDMRKRAESRASEINAAYDRVKEQRGFK